MTWLEEDQWKRWLHPLSDLKEYSILPKDYKSKDPRNLLYHFPSLPIVKYAKLMQTFSFHQALGVAEDLGHRLGYVLLPSHCMHWQRIQKNGERRVKIGRNSFYLMRLNELTRNEKSKLINHIEEVQNGEYRHY